MIEELSAWNGGKGIDLESWIGCNGNFRLAVGYATIFCPRFTLFEDYILRENFSVGLLRSFEKSCKGDRRSVEWVMNHFHIADIQHCGCKDISRDRVLFIGNALKEIHEAKLSWQFPDRPVEVELFVPDDPNDLKQYQITFFQPKP
jgi:hypothetical protein